MEEKKALLSQEQQKFATENESNSDVGDDLDAYMTGISSQLGNRTKLIYDSFFFSITMLFLFADFVTSGKKMKLQCLSDLIIS